MLVVDLYGCDCYGFVVDVCDDVIVVDVIFLECIEFFVVEGFVYIVWVVEFGDVVVQEGQDVGSDLLVEFV